MICAEAAADDRALVFGDVRGTLNSKSPECLAFVAEAVDWPLGRKQPLAGRFPGIWNEPADLALEFDIIYYFDRLN
jgi:hypothetical protein